MGPKNLLKIKDKEILSANFEQSLRMFAYLASALFKLTATILLCVDR